MVKKGFSRGVVDLVKRAIGAVINPEHPEKYKVAVQPGSNNGLGRSKAKVKKLPAKKKRVGSR